MSNTLSTGWMIGLDLIMMVYTLRIFAKAGINRRLCTIIGGVGTLWLGLLYVGLSSRALFPPDISGFVFLGIIVSFVALVGLGLWFTSLRTLIDVLSQQDLALMQGVRVFFGATFLMQAALGGLPIAFGIVDGLSHITAGFLGLFAAALAGLPGNRRLWFAHLFGLTDILVVASTLSFVLLPIITPHHSMMYAVFLPAPVWLLSHVVALVKLSKNEAALNPKTRWASPEGAKL